MPHPRNLIIKLLIVSLVIIVTIFAFKPSKHSQVLAQTPCGLAQVTGQSQIIVNSGFLSLKSSSNYYNFAATDTSSNCLVSSFANIESEFDTYASLENTYYTQSNYPNKCESPTNPSCDLTKPNPFNGNQTQIIHSATAVTLNGNNQIQVNGVYVVFIDGDLEIQNNIVPNPFSPNSEGLVLVVGGNIHIDATVSEVDAFMMTYKDFCDNWSNSSCSNNPEPTGSITINGSITSFAPAGQGSFYLTRVSPNPSTTPAESVNYQPKYFALVKDIFSKNKTIWTEIK